MRAGLVLAAGLTLALAGFAEAQRPRAEIGRFEVPGMDWGPSAAWRTRAARVRANRWSALQRGDLRQLNSRGVFLATPGARSAPSAFAVTGTFKVPVVLLAYKNVDVAYPVAEFRSLLFDPVPPAGRAYTLKTYYEQVSRNRIQMDGEVFPPVRMDSIAAYYENNCNGIGIVVECSDGGRRFGLMLIAALDSLSNGPAGVDRWSAYDNDGLDGIPNSGDDDGVVDFVTFLQPTKDGSCGAKGIWAHRFVISGWNNGSPYVTRTPRAGAPGQFLRVDNYTIQSQLGGSTGCNEAFIMPVGTVAHETGHAFGLPDLYDTSGGSEGIGEWGIMGSGNYAQAYSPASYDPWSLNELGWITVDTLGGTREVVTAPRVLSDTVFLARMVSPNEYLLIENRQPIFSDTAMFNPTLEESFGVPPAPCRSRCPKLPGLLLWHIDTERIEAARQSNRINTGPVHGVALVQADGFNSLRGPAASRNRGDRGDSYPGSSGATRWSLTTTPAARTNVQDFAGFIIDRIEQQPAGAMRFRVVERKPSLFRVAVAGATIVVNGFRSGRFEDVIAAGDPIALDVDEFQETIPGRSRARWLGWSIGGPRTQALTSGPTPDTVVALFSTEHRVRVVNAGGGHGSVSSSAGALTSGVFVSHATAVTVTAEPGPGSIFTGWRGDTTEANPTVILPMERPYDLEATFAPALQVTVTAATAEILGTATLSIEERLFLDDLGNRNGVYDLGDYLAHLRRNGQAVSPAVLRAAVGRDAARAGGRAASPEEAR